MDIEASAKAMFDSLHARFNRIRDWAAHPDGDSGAGELGRDSFRAMATAVAGADAGNPDAVPAAEASVQAQPEVAPALTTDNYPAANG